MNKKTLLMGFAVLASLSNSTMAFSNSSVAVEFSEKELEAAFTLLRPELLTLDISGKEGVVTPPPSLKYLGASPVHFPINLNFIANVVDLKFNHIKNRPFEVRFQPKGQPSGLMLSIPLEDQDKAIQSILGSMSFKNIVLQCLVDVETGTSGAQSFVLKSVNVNGTFTGTGILKNKQILNKARELLVNTTSDQLKKILSGDKVQAALESGLLYWSKFYNGQEFTQIVPESVFLNETGLHYQVD